MFIVIVKNGKYPKRESVGPQAEEVLANTETHGLERLITVEDVGEIVNSILNEEDAERQIQMGKELIDAAVEAGIVAPSRWDEKLNYPEDGHEDGFSFQWVNHYRPTTKSAPAFVCRFEGWQEVAKHLHVLTKEIPELKDYALSLLQEE